MTREMRIDCVPEPVNSGKNTDHIDRHFAKLPPDLATAVVGRIMVLINHGGGIGGDRPFLEVDKSGKMMVRSQSRLHDRVNYLERQGAFIHLKAELFMEYPTLPGIEGFVDRFVTTCLATREVTDSFPVAITHSGGFNPIPPAALLVAVHPGGFTPKVRGISKGTAFAGLLAVFAAILLVVFLVRKTTVKSEKQLSAPFLPLPQGGDHGYEVAPKALLSPTVGEVEAGLTPLVRKSVGETSPSTHANDQPPKLIKPARPIKRAKILLPKVVSPPQTSNPAVVPPPSPPAMEEPCDIEAVRLVEAGKYCDGLSKRAEMMNRGRCPLSTDWHKVRLQFREQLRACITTTNATTGQ